ncbi:EF-hand domain-containing family member C2, partial [Syngnathoides biaculeatus]|uniref:EF-hand domain-containing family member C2 n=1 Tax=Syngnathoides biaculeatus TaxID=300417 RepID=UPI002ADE2A10
RHTRALLVLSVALQLLKENFHKRQQLDYSGGVPLLAPAEEPGRRLRAASSVYPEGATRGLPSWLAFDKQALRFEAYFREAVPEAPDESDRIRTCRIYFYPEDDTIQVVEPKYKNSGLAQGTLIGRQRIPLPPPDHERFYNVFHFNLNRQVALFSRIFTVTDCDQFTRNFLAKCGVILNQPVAVPQDPYRRLREKMETSASPLRPYERRDTLKQFLEHDGKVLRFLCLWDEKRAAGGDTRQLLLLRYFLADDTVDIRRVGGGAAFLRRGKLPKQTQERRNLPGEASERTVLNVRGDRFLLDSLKTGAAREEFYKDCDLTLGGELNVWGRKVIIADCDDFTKDFYRAKYGVEDFKPVQYESPAGPDPPGPVPPYNGFGSEEDSLGSCGRLLPKPPQKDLLKFLHYDRCGLESNVLKFSAKMESGSQADGDRDFVVSFHLSDDTISVFERSHKNSGLPGGMFLSRARVKKPGQESFKSEPSRYFGARDLRVGAALGLNGRRFRLLDADEYTLNFMERHAEQFPDANIDAVLAKLGSVPEEKQREIRNFLTHSDPSNTGFVTFDSFRSLQTATDCGLSEHEVLVLARSFAERRRPREDVGLTLAAAQHVLKKKNFDRLPDMRRVFQHRDVEGTGHASVKDARTVCKSFQLPLSDKLLAHLLRSFADGERLDYGAFLSAVDWLERPAPPATPDDILKFDVTLRSDDGGVKNINYSSLLRRAFPGEARD